MRSVLRKNGRFSTLAARIYEKRRVLSSIGVTYLSPIPDVPSADEVLEWYFTSHLATSHPDDIATHCRALGFKDEEAFVAAVRRQLWYVEATRDRSDPPVHNVPDQK